MISIDYNKPVKNIRNFWNNILFHPTDAIEDEWGQKILDCIADDHIAETVRIYAMLEDIVTQDEEGNLHYDFTLNDLRIDYLLGKGFNLFITYAFLPPFCIENPEIQSSVSKNKTRYKGKMIYTGRVKKDAPFEEICYEYTKHITERYGEETVAKWYLQCYNEPDVSLFFLGEYGDDSEGVQVRLKEYLKLYQQFSAGVKRVSNRYRVGQSLAHRADFLEGFLQTVKKENIPYDFGGIHAYGTSPRRLKANITPLSELTNLEKIQIYEGLIHQYFPGLEIIVDEWGAASGGFCNMEECPALIFREDSGFAAFFGKMLTAYINENLPISKMMICLSGQHEMKVDFSGFRGFFTLNQFKKPIYNAYVLGTKILGTLFEGESDHSNLSVLPTADGRNYSILLSYASPHYDEALPSVQDTIEIAGIKGNYHVTVYCIDELHTNPYQLSLRNRYDQNNFTKEQIEILREEGRMKPLKEQYIIADGKVSVDIGFTNNALVLVELKEI